MIHHTQFHSPKSSLPWSLWLLFVSDIWVPPSTHNPQNATLSFKLAVSSISRPQDSGPVSMSAAQGQSEASPPPPRLLVIPATFLASSAAALAATAIETLIQIKQRWNSVEWKCVFIRQKIYCVDFQAIFLNVRGESKIIIKLNWIEHRKFATFKQNAFQDSCLTCLRDIPI